MLPSLRLLRFVSCVALRFRLLYCIACADFGFIIHFIVAGQFARASTSVSVAFGSSFRSRHALFRFPAAVLSDVVGRGALRSAGPGCSYRLSDADGQPRAREQDHRSADSLNIFKVQRLALLLATGLEPQIGLEMGL